VEIDLWWFRHSASLEIYGTSLKSLDLDSLREIRSGDVSIRGNPQLCYANNINWRRLVSRRNMYYVSDNRDAAACGKYLC